MTPATVSQALAEIQAELDRPRDTSKLAAERDILAQLPEHLAAPVVSVHQFRDSNGSIMFRDRTYGQGDYNPAGILAALEGAGWASVPTSWAKYGRYRGGAWPMAVDKLPELNGRDELADCQAIAPVWLQCNYHTGAEARAFMRSPGGAVWGVDIQLPGRPISASARRVEYRGGWRFERNSAQLHAPFDCNIAGEVVAQRARQSGAAIHCAEPSQSVEGWAYYELVSHEPDDSPYTPSDILAGLLAS